MLPLAPSKIANSHGHWLEYILVAIVAVTAATFAALLFANYYANPDLLWRDFYHDRNSHLSFGLDLAIAARDFDPVWFFSELEKSKVWPPLHGLVLSAVLLIAGIDHRYAIVPSLIGWVVTIVFVWLITRELFRSRMPGVFAAAFAVILTAASPSFRLLASDVMLEGLGAGLSAIALWAYLRSRDEPQSKSRWHILALTLTALFFHKGNYWGLVIAAFAFDFVFGNVRHAVTFISLISEKARFTDFARNILHDPLLVSFGIVVAIFGALYRVDPTVIVLFGLNIRLGGPSENLVTVAFAILFIRGFLIWRRHRGEIDATLGLGGRTIFYWHVLPIAISFLLPKRLSTFLWFIGPSNSYASFNPLDGIVTYWNGFAEGFHIATWMAILSVSLALLGAIQLRALRPGSRVVFLFVLMSWIAVIVHPQHQSRFLASWLFAVWICAGAGAGVIFTWILSRRPRVLQLIFAGAITVALAAAMVLEKPSPRSFAHAIHPTDGPPDLDLVRPYLHELEGAHDVSIATTFGSSRLFRWAIHEHCQCKVTITDLFIDSRRSRDDVRTTMTDRIANSNSDVFVVIDAPGSRYSFAELGWVYEKMVGVVDAMQSQTRFGRTATYSIPSHGAEASIWRRQDGGEKKP